MNHAAVKGQEHAMVLSGGGAHGAYEIGVMEALFEGRSPSGEPVRPSVFCGTSVGAYNAAAMVSQLSRREPDYLGATAHLRRLWLERIAAHERQPTNGVYRLRGDPRYVLGPAFMANPLENLAALGQDASHAGREMLTRALNFSLSSGSLTRRSLQALDLSNLFSTKPLQKLVTETIDLERILSPEALRLRVTATDWDTGEVVVFGNGEQRKDLGYETGKKRWASNARARYRVHDLDADCTHRAVLASAAIPALFPCVELDGKPMVDGGLLMNTPLKPAIDAGAQVMHIIYLDPKLEKLPLGHLPNILDTIDRLLVASWAYRIKEDITYTQMVRRLITQANSIEAFVGREAEAGPETEADAARRGTREFIDQFAGWPLLTVHRYFPSRDIGGILTMLDFKLESLIELIELGFEDTVHHDCEANGCVIDAAL